MVKMLQQINLKYSRRIIIQEELLRFQYLPIHSTNLDEYGGKMFGYTCIAVQISGGSVNSNCF
jgi:hypothetical protein